MTKRAPMHKFIDAKLLGHKLSEDSNTIMELLRVNGILDDVRSAMDTFMEERGGDGMSDPVCSNVCVCMSFCFVVFDKYQKVYQPGEERDVERVFINLFPSGQSSGMAEHHDVTPFATAILMLSGDDSAGTALQLGLDGCHGSAQMGLGDLIIFHALPHSLPLCLRNLPRLSANFFG